MIYFKGEKGVGKPILELIERGLFAFSNCPLRFSLTRSTDFNPSC